MSGQYTQGPLACFDEYDVSLEAESNIGNSLAGWHVIGNPEKGNGEMFAVMHFHGTPEAEYDANSERLIALWNALAGIENPAAFVEAARGMAGVLERLQYWFDTDPEIIAAMSADEQVDNARQLAGIRTAIAAFRAQIGEA